MLSLNIHSPDYMCIDIDPDSVIHKHLVKKIMDMDGSYPMCLYLNHCLTMLDSFHISLGEPPQTEEEKEAFEYYEAKELCHMNIVPIIGDITLAPICISEKNGKKSAWIPLHPEWITDIWLEDDGTGIGYALNIHRDFDSFDHRCDERPVKHLHVSVANLTGKSRDSITRPEDCIIDTITN